MKIRPQTLLAMPLCVLQFSDPYEAKANVEEFNRQTSITKSITEEGLQRFGFVLFKRLSQSHPGERIEIDFPNKENQKEWGEYFKLENGSFFIKEDKFDELLKVAYYFTRRSELELRKELDVFKAAGVKPEKIRRDFEVIKHYLKVALRTKCSEK